MRTFLFIILLMLSAYIPQTGFAQTDEVRVVEKLHAALIAAMKSGDSCGKRREALKPVLEKSFNLDRMAKLSVGSAWRKMSDAEKKSFAEAFKNVTYNTYASRFKSYKGERFESLGEKPGIGETVLVETNLIKANGEIVELNYLLKNSEIIDIFLKGNISELAMKKAEYTSILESSSVNDLVVKLKEKVQGCDK